MTTSTEALNKVLEHIVQGVAMFDSSQKLVIWNRHYEQVLQYPEGYLKPGLSNYEMALFHANREGFGKGDPKQLADKRLKQIWSGEITKAELTINGTRVYKTLFQKTNDGGLVYTYTDITERKLTEKSLRESEERLTIQILEMQDKEERLEKQAADLVAMAEDLTETRNQLELLNEQKNKFFSIIAHDLKGPFNALLGYSSLLSTQAETFEPAMIARSADAVHESAKQVYELLENLLDWSRLQMDQMDFETETVDLAELITNNVRLFEPIAASKNIVLIIEGPTLSVLAHALMIDTILRNLIANAVKFTTSRGSVTIKTIADGDWVDIEIIDTGVGMTQDKVDRLFKLDEKTTTTGTNGEVGTGLGLHLCKDLTEKQGGRIQVISTEGVGSTFRVSFPTHPE